MTRMREHSRLIRHLKARRESDARCRWSRRAIFWDGIPGAWAVAAALDAMAPDGPPVLIRQGRSALPQLDFELSKVVLHAKYLELS
jgi:hypothetical protein